MRTLLWIAVLGWSTLASAEVILVPRNDTSNNSNYNAERAPEGSVLLAMLPDTGERYLSTFLFEGVNEGSDDEWLASLDAAAIEIARAVRGARHTGIAAVRGRVAAECAAITTVVAAATVAPEAASTAATEPAAASSAAMSTTAPAGEGVGCERHQCHPADE